jgi:CheY-like chemotaxis protein
MGQANVLVVEDDDGIRKLLIAALRERSSLTVDGARDGRDALHQILTNHYAVVVLDVMMPYMSGIDLLDSLKAVLNDPSLGRIERTPAVIIVTGLSNDVIGTAEMRQRFPKIVSAVLRKPVDMAGLAKKVESLL